MQFETLKDVLHWTREFHQQLSDSLLHSSSKNSDERARMTLTYLSDHEKALANVVSVFAASGEEHALNTWCIEYIVHKPITQQTHVDEPFVSLDATQIISLIVDQHEQVIELYRYLASRADIPSAIELLETLSAMEEHEMMRMVQSTNRFGDL
jgi:GTP-binding protein EngB required for normal cell division